MVIAVDIFQKRSYAGCGNSKKLRYRTLPPSSVFLYLQIGVLSFISHITHLLVPLTGLGRDRPDGNGGAGETRPATLVLEEKLGRQNWPAGGQDEAPGMGWGNGFRTNGPPFMWHPGDIRPGPDPDVGAHLFYSRSSGHCFKIYYCFDHLSYICM